MSSLFKPAHVTAAKLKCGIFGDAGSGKTMTAILIMIGLCQLTKTKKPIFFQDTENGSDFIIDLVMEAGLPRPEVLKSRSFVDLKAGVKEAEKAAAGFIVDSETHIWNDFTESYLKKTGQSFIEIWDWKHLKKDWAEWTDLFNSTDLHIIRCGRAGAVYEQQEEIRHGKKKSQAVKVGTKMKTETEGGYEPSLLLEMAKVMDQGSGYYKRMCHVIKDRTRTIDSKEFLDPTFANFLPHIKKLNLTGTHQGIDTSRNSDDQFVGIETGDSKKFLRSKRRKILCEEITGLLNKYFPSSAGKDKIAKQEIVFDLLKTRSWEAVQSDWENITLERLEDIMTADLENGEASELELACVNRSEELSEPKAKTTKK